MLCVEERTNRFWNARNANAVSLSRCVSAFNGLFSLWLAWEMSMRFFDHCTTLHSKASSTHYMCMNKATPKVVSPVCYYYLCIGWKVDAKKCLLFLLLLFIVINWMISRCTKRQYLYEIHRSLRDMIWLARNMWAQSAFQIDRRAHTISHQTQICMQWNSVVSQALK